MLLELVQTRTQIHLVQRLVRGDPPPRKLAELAQRRPSRVGVPDKLRSLALLDEREQPPVDGIGHRGALEALVHSGNHARD